MIAVIFILKQGLTLCLVDHMYKENIVSQKVNYSTFADQIR